MHNFGHLLLIYLTNICGLYNVLLLLEMLHMFSIV